MISSDQQMMDRGGIGRLERCGDPIQRRGLPGFAFFEGLLDWFRRCGEGREFFLQGIRADIHERRVGLEQRLHLLGALLFLVSSAFCIASRKDASS